MKINTLLCCWSGFVAACAWVSVAVAGPSLTIYNDNFAVVRDTVPIELQAGIQSVSYSGVTRFLEPQSVVLRDPAGQVTFRVLEQSYRGDPVTERRLLAQFEGQTIRFLRTLDGRDVTVTGRIVRAPAPELGLDPVIEVNGELRFDLPGRPLFPDLGDDSILQPTISWRLFSREAAQFDAQLSYLTSGLSWSSDYNLVLPEEGDSVLMTGWVSLTNRSGKTFRDAKLKLLAGTVNRVVERQRVGPMVMRAAAMDSFAGEPEEVEERKFDEFYIYTLPGETDLRDQETKQVEFVRADGVQTRRIYKYVTPLRHRFGRTPAENPDIVMTAPSAVAVFREFKNSEENGLGGALPAGIMRFYRADRDGQIEFVGENRIGHTPRNETITVHLGNAFDLVAQRSRTDFFRHRSERLMRESFEIEIRNRGEEAVTVEVVEPLFRWSNWSILSSSLPHERIDSQTIRFTVPVEADGKTVLAYTVEYTW